MRKHRSHDLVPVEDCLIDAHHPPDTTVHGTGFGVAEDGFWQVHPGAPTALVDAVLEALDPRPGESALDLFAGVGLFSRFLLERVGDGGRVVAVEGEPAAAGLIGTNAPGAEAHTGDVAAVLAGADVAPQVDLVVLDPPRVGARREVVESVVARRPRAVAHVACDPAALARDVALFAQEGYRLDTLRAFDLFPMTHHVECVARLVPERGRAQRTTS